MQKSILVLFKLIITELRVCWQKNNLACRVREAEGNVRRERSVISCNLEGIATATKDNESVNLKI